MTSREISKMKLPAKILFNFLVDAGNSEDPLHILLIRYLYIIKKLPLELKKHGILSEGNFPVGIPPDSNLPSGFVVDGVYPGDIVRMKNIKKCCLAYDELCKDQDKLSTLESIARELSAERAAISFEDTMNRLSVLVHSLDYSSGSDHFKTYKFPNTKVIEFNYEMNKHVLDKYDGKTKDLVEQMIYCVCFGHTVEDYKDPKKWGENNIAKRQYIASIIDTLEKEYPEHRDQEVNQGFRKDLNDLIRKLCRKLPPGIDEM